MTTLASLVSFGSLGLSACGGTPPPTRTAGSASVGESSGSGAGAASAGSLSDSALGPAARKAALDEDWGDSERLYRELVRRRPGDADARRGLGMALMREGKNIEAVVALNESLELRDALETRLALAENYGDMDRYPSALPHLRRAVAIDPQGVDGWVALTHALVKVEKADGAVEVLDESGRVCRACRSDAGWLRGKDEVARALLARAEKQMGAGDVKGANRSLDAAAGLNPALPETHLGRAKIARTQGDDTRAASEFRQAVDSLPATAEPGASARLELARLLTYRGEGAEATRLARQVVDARGENLASLDVLGRACDANKDADCARKAYGRLMSLPLASSEPSGGADGGDGGPSVARKAVDHARARLKALKKGGRRRR